MALVLDTGVIYAALDSGQPDHERCAALFELREELVVPTPVLVELDYWLHKAGAHAAWDAFVEDVSDRIYTLFPIDAALLDAAAVLQRRFADQDIGLVDAVVFSVCETLGERRVATLDRRHFSILRTQEGHSLELLPSMT